jgi:3-hydroxyisobutyrate dehydrogenase
VLDQLGAAAKPGLVLIDHTTTSVEGSRARRARLEAQGLVFQHAPVFMGPQNALEGTGTMLASGDREQVEQLRPTLERMTGKLIYLGPKPEQAAALKLLGNLYLMFITTGVSEVLTLAKAMHVEPPQALELFRFFNPGANLEPRLARILGAHFEQPSWELAMARKDARLMLEEAERAGTDLSVLPAIAATMDRFIARGFAHHDWTVIAKDALAR